MFAGIVFVLAGLLLLAYEFYTILTGKPTISQSVWALYKRWPFIGVLAGLVAGSLLTHFFWT